MGISKMLGATMVAGAIATGGAAAGIAGAADSPGTTHTNSDASGGESGTGSRSTTNTPGAPTRARGSKSQKSGAPGRGPCPHMGSGRRGETPSDSGAASSYAA